MSFRDTRNFLEMLRALGYPKLVSMESFRKPNFALVAALLVWLTKRFDPDTDIPLEIGTEDERVRLIRNTAQFMALKASVKLNTKKLYQADGYAVKELLKVTTLLYTSLNVDLNETEQYTEETFNLRDFDINDKINELKLSRQLASEITATGATLFDLLGKENDLRPIRQKSVNRQFEVQEIEGGIKAAIDTIKSDLQETKQLIDNVAANEASLDSKIERRKVDIDRYEKRLQTLKKVRPAFLEEFTSLEQELEALFVQYSIRLRILHQLEQQFTESERIRFEKQLQITSPRVQTIPLDHNDPNNDLFLDEEVLQMHSRPVKTGTANKRQERPRASTGGRSKLEKVAKTYGSMHPKLSGSQSSLDLSSDSETDDLFVDKDEPELVYSDEESLALELSNPAGVGRVPTGRKTSSKVQSNSDDDF